MGSLCAVSGGPRPLSAPWGTPWVPQIHAVRVIMKPYLLNGPVHGVLAYVSEQSSRSPHPLGANNIK